jgi:hypothetical protein
VAEVEGRSFAFELSLAHGLGLVGVGAPAAIRAFMIERLFAYVPGETVMVIPTLDLADLLGCRSPAVLPELPLGLQPVDSLDEALDLLEMQALARALPPSEPTRPERWSPTYILIAMTSRYDLTRLQVVLELGAGYGVAGLLLGHWRSGVTVSVQTDGRACPVSPGLSTLMRGVPLGGMDAARAASLLSSIGKHEPRFPPPPN